MYGIETPTSLDGQRDLASIITVAEYDAICNASNINNKSYKIVCSGQAKRTWPIMPKPARGDALTVYKRKLFAKLWIELNDIDESLHRATACIAKEATNVNAIKYIVEAQKQRSMAEVLLKELERHA